MSLTSYRAAPPRVSRVTSIHADRDRGEGESWECGPGGDLLFRTLGAVPSALRVFTAEFGMGSGVWPLAMATRPASLAPAEAGVLSCDWEGSVWWGRVPFGSCRCTRAVLCWGFKRQSSD
jgi:hypothetical protein